MINIWGRQVFVTVDHVHNGGFGQATAVQAPGVMLPLHLRLSWDVHA
jgi:hypothetical protein